MKRTLLNPFFLIGQGFLAGAALFYSIAPGPAVQPVQDTASLAAPQIAGI